MKGERLFSLCTSMNCQNVEEVRLLKKSQNMEKNAERLKCSEITLKSMLIVFWGKKVNKLC